MNQKKNLVLMKAEVEEDEGINISFNRLTNKRVSVKYPFIELTV